MGYKEIYDKAFSCEKYNLHNQDEFRYKYALNHIKNNPNISSVIDVGSGRGTLIKMIRDFSAKIKIDSVDLSNFHNFENINFFNCNLLLEEDRKKISNLSHDLLVCLDVLEHLQKEEIDNIMRLFSNIAPYSIISIANHSDIHQGTELHTIQEDMSYWQPIICKYFDIINYSTSYIMDDGKILLYILLIRSKENKRWNQNFLLNFEKNIKMDHFTLDENSLKIYFNNSLNSINQKQNEINENIINLINLKFAEINARLTSIEKKLKKKSPIKRLTKNIINEFRKLLFSKQP